MSHTSLSTKTPPNKRFQPTASLAALASRRLKREPLGGDVRVQKQIIHQYKEFSLCQEKEQRLKW